MCVCVCVCVCVFVCVLCVFDNTAIVWLITFTMYVCIETVTYADGQCVCMCVCVCMCRWMDECFLRCTLSSNTQSFLLRKPRIVSAFI